MLNQSGITKTTGYPTNQILASTNLQYSVSIMVANTGVEADAKGKKILKAGTPLSGSLETRGTAFKKATTSTGSGGSSSTSNATVILLHDVDVTAGNANATALVFGFVDLNKIDSTTKSLLDEATKKALPKITFVA